MSHEVAGWVAEIGQGVIGFNVLRGGEYLFMPSLSALTWLAKLGD